ncbi:hypothetical protein D3C81_1948040 [compost metagenome]
MPCFSRSGAIAFRISAWGSGEAPTTRVTGSAAGSVVGSAEASEAGALVAAEFAALLALLLLPQAASTNTKVKLKNVSNTFFICKSPSI